MQKSNSLPPSSLSKPEARTVILLLVKATMQTCTQPKSQLSDRLVRRYLYLLCVCQNWAAFTRVRAHLRYKIVCVHMHHHRMQTTRNSMSTHLQKPKQVWRSTRKYGGKQSLACKYCTDLGARVAHVEEEYVLGRGAVLRQLQGLGQAPVQCSSRSLVHQLEHLEACNVRSVEDSASLRATCR
jgi:hypothetical protein